MNARILDIFSDSFAGYIYSQSSILICIFNILMYFKTQFVYRVAIITCHMDFEALGIASSLFLTFLPAYLVFEQLAVSCSLNSTYSRVIRNTGEQYFYHVTIL